MELPGVGRGHRTAAERKILAILMIPMVGKTFLLLRHQTVATPICEKTGSAKMLIGINPVPLVVRRLIPSSFWPSLTGLNGAPGGRTVFKQ